MPDTKPTGAGQARRRRAPTTPAARVRGLAQRWRAWLLTPNLLPFSAIMIASVAAAAALLVSFSDTPLAGSGEIAPQSRTIRTDFTIVDADATARDRDDARRRTPRIYAANRPVLDEIGSSLRSLPAALAAADSLEAVAPEIARRFGLNDARFAMFRGIAQSEDALARWNARVSAFASALEATPVLTAEEFGLAAQSASPEIILAADEDTRRRVRTTEAISLAAEDAGERLSRRAAQALEPAELDAAVFAVLHLDQPTFTFDRERTELLQDTRSEDVPPVQVRYREGQSIYIEGDRVTREQAGLAREESRRYTASLTLVQRALRWLAALATAALLAAILAAYVRAYYAGAARSPLRAASIAVLVVAGAAAACWGIAVSPSLLWFAAVGPVALASMVIATAFDRRLAVMIGATLAVLTGLSLELPVGYFLVALSAAVISAWRLSTVRHRSDVLRGGALVAATLAFATLAVVLVSRPASGAILRDALIDAVWAGLAGLLAAALTLVLLPLVERLFDVTTGMTLSELRDSSHPLLRELQQRAPGTFNHSHTVAIIAEAAADAIGADGKHVYVGAMYHDIGKMHKPEYFVENQTGANRSVHERLSPAMSLLVIVAHVKDGLELARDAALPRPLRHYIESHHGTTLVQYFFHRAKQQAEDAEGAVEAPREVEYRYPGPKPRTREAAVLLLADSVEAATRAMTEPTPARISALVREISRKYLDDGQFDDASITLRELTAVEDSIIKSLCGIYHARVAYPKATTRERAADAEIDQPGAGEPKAEASSA